MAATLIAKSKKIRAPKLIRLALIHVDARKRPAEKIGKLEYSGGREATIQLFPPSKDYNFCRIKVVLNVKLELKDDNYDQPRISFAADYEGRFVYSEDVSHTRIKEWMKSDMYCQCIIAQAAPLANAHMYAQLSMMGLNTNKHALGFDFDAAEKIPVITGTKRRSKRAKLP